MSIKYTLKLTKKSGEVVWYRKLTKTRISSVISRTPMKSCYLRVGYQPDIYNDGDFTKKEDALRALRCFTEKDLVLYATDKVF